MSLMEKFSAVEIKADNRISEDDKAFCLRQQEAFDIYTLFQLAQVRDDNRYVNGFTDKLLRQSEIDLGVSRDSMPCLLDEKKIVNYPCSRACPLFGDCVTKWYQVRKRA